MGGRKNKQKQKQKQNLSTVMLAMGAEASRHTLPGCRQRKAPLFCLEVSRGEARPAAPLTLGSTDYFFEGSVGEGLVTSLIHWPCPQRQHMVVKGGSPYPPGLR